MSDPAASPPAAADPAAAHAAPVDPKSREAIERRERRVLARLLERFPREGGVVVGEVTHRQVMFVTVRPDAIAEVLGFLRDDPSLGFSMFVDVTCADYLKLPELAPARFGLLYIAYSPSLDAYARIRCYVDADDPAVPTVSGVYPGAGWAEREVWDLYGIAFAGHKDLRRIVLPDDYTGHPLRKDYPLKGRGERDSFPVISRSEG